MTTYLRVECTSSFIEEKNTGIRDNRARNCDSLC
jgi:hypothetical protein